MSAFTKKSQTITILLIILNMTCLLLSCETIGSNQKIGSRPDYKLLHATDMVYLGAFRVPRGTYGCSDRSICSFYYGGSAITYNAANNSLFMVGHDNGQRVAEISIPQIVNSTNISALGTATVLQNFSDVTEGEMARINAGGAVHTAASVKMGGMMVYGNKLIGSVYSYYDGNWSAVRSHFTSGLTLSKTGDFAGIFKVGTLNPGFMSVYMTKIPKAWQSQFGGPALTGGAALAIADRSSWGPAAFVFDPDILGSGTDTHPVPATPVVYYPSRKPTLGTYKGAGNNPSYNGTAQVRGIVFPEGSNSVLFFGRRGTGQFCYGVGTGDSSLHRTPVTGASSEIYCYDPAKLDKGDHAYPYQYQVWAYNADDLVSVKKGNKQPWDVKPYAVWNFDLPFQSKNRSILGAAYDPATQRIFVSQANGEGNGTDGYLPVVHVFKIKGIESDTTSPAMRSNKR